MSAGQDESSVRVAVSACGSYKLFCGQTPSDLHPWLLRAAGKRTASNTACQEMLIEFTQDKELRFDPEEACQDRPFFPSPRSCSRELSRQKAPGIRCCCFVCAGAAGGGQSRGRAAAVHRGVGLFLSRGQSLPCTQSEMERIAFSLCDSNRVMAGVFKVPLH